MKNVIALAVVVIALGFAGSANALALYDLQGTTSGEPNIRLYGTLGVEGIDSFSDLQDGREYTWFYNLSYFELLESLDLQFLGTRSHSGTADATVFETNYFLLAGDDNSLLTHTEDVRWHDPFLTGLGESFAYIGLQQINLVQPAPVPEPSAILLFASGLVGLIFFRKRIGNFV